MWRTDSEPNSEDPTKWDGIILFGNKPVLRTRKSYDHPGMAMLAAEDDFVARLGTVLAAQSGSE